MTDQDFEEAVSKILFLASKDSSIMTGLPDVDLQDPQLRFVRVIEICEKIELLRKSAPDRYDWYLRLSSSDVKKELAWHWANRRVPKR